MRSTAQVLSVIDGNEYSPDFDGLTRIEWTGESLPYAHNSGVLKWEDVSSGLVLRPTGTAPVLRSGKYVEFNGITDELGVSGLNLDMSGGINIFTVFKPTERAGLVAGRQKNAPHTQTGFELYFSGSLKRKTFAANRDSELGLFTVDSPASHTRKQLLVARPNPELDPIGEVIRVDGKPSVIAGANGPLGAPANPIHELYTHGYVGGLFSGHLYALLIYYGAFMTTKQVLTVEASLNSRFSVY